MKLFQEKDDAKPSVVEDGSEETEEKAKKDEKEDSKEKDKKKKTKKAKIKSESPEPLGIDDDPKDTQVKHSEWYMKF